MILKYDLWPQFWVTRPAIHINYTSNWKMSDYPSGQITNYPVFFHWTTSFELGLVGVEPTSWIIYVFAVDMNMNVNNRIITEPTVNPEWMLTTWMDLRLFEFSNEFTNVRMDSWMYFQYIRWLSRITAPFFPYFLHRFPPFIWAVDNDTGVLLPLPSINKLPLTFV